MEKLGKLIFQPPEGNDNYHYTSPDRVRMLPIGTKVLVENYGRVRPYEVVRWGKHYLKRLKWIRKDDWNLLGADEFLPIRKTRGLKFKIMKKGRKK